MVLGHNYLALLNKLTSLFSNWPILFLGSFNIRTQKKETVYFISFLDCMRSCDKSNLHKNELELYEFWFLSIIYFIIDSPLIFWILHCRWSLSAMWLNGWKRSRSYTTDTLHSLISPGTSIQTKPLPTQLLRWQGT